LWAGTFHSFGLQILRRFHKHAGLSPYFGIVDQTDCNAVLKELIKDVKNSGKDKFDLDKILSMINDRRTGLAPEMKLSMNIMKWLKFLRQNLQSA